MAKENTTKYIVLGLLSHEPMSGYDMKKRIDTMVSQFWNVGYGQLYPTLSGLRREGLIEEVLSEVAKGPMRHVYAITNSGREQLHTWLLLPEEKEYTRYEILLKLFFGGSLESAVSRQRIEAFQQRYQQALSMLDLFEENLRQVMALSPDHKNYYIAVRFGQHVYTAYLDWAQEALKLFEESGNAAREGIPHEQEN